MFDYYSNQYNRFFLEYFDVELTNDPNEEGITLALFTGGADVNPDYYGEAMGVNTFINKQRDTLEEEMFNSLSNDILKVGICRGSQFLTVMSGGKLIQHVTGHGQSHNIITKDGVIMEVTSTHHQMMYPFEMKKEEYEIIAHASSFLSDKYLNGENRSIDLPDNFEECEIVKYNKFNCICVQGHPEFGHATKEFKNYVIQLIENELQK